jgi:zinc protease
MSGTSGVGRWVPTRGSRVWGPRWPWILPAISFVAALVFVPLDAAVRPPPMRYSMRTLANGLTVVLSEDHSTPIVHADLWYHVGAKDERPGRTGFAHLFEHMMFKGSKNVEPEHHASMIASVGGQSNAYTNDDTTVFWETVPSHYLPLVVWLEADRMATLRIDENTFKAEREVVKEERRLRIDNQPYGRLSEMLYDRAFAMHPYKHATIGSMTDLDAASVADVRDFHNTYYVPGNATLALVGDFDSAQALDLVNKYFGRIPKSDRPVARDYPKEPPSAAEQRFTAVENWPLPVVVVAYHITYDGHPDSYPLHLISKIMSDGESSRIYKSLVYDKGIAVSAAGGGHIIEEPNLFFAVAVLQRGHTAAEAEKALIAEFDRLREEPVPERELQRAKNQFSRDYIVDRESARGKAGQLAHAVVIHHDITTADGEVDIFAGLKVADLQRVARTYFTPENRVVLTVLPRTEARQ